MARTTIPPELVAVNAIQGTLIADNSVTAVHIATNAISGTLVADNAITSTHIAQNNVTATQIAQNTITVTQMADDAIETAKINDSAVTTAKINNGAITEGKLAANSVTSAKIVNGTIVAADLADNAVTIAKMASLARGSIIYGDSAGDPGALSLGTTGKLLVSDGTDIGWSSAINATTTFQANDSIRISSYNAIGQTSSGAMGIFGHNARVDGTAYNTIKAINSSWPASFIKMYYDQGISFHVTSGNVTAGDTLLSGVGTNTHERMRILNNGRVGIGENEPDRQVHIKGTTSVGGRLKLENTDASAYAGTVMTSSSREFHIGVGGASVAAGLANSLYFYDGTAGVNRMYLDASGNFNMISALGSNASTAYGSMGSRIMFDNDYSDTQRGPNKIVTQNDGAWIAGLGISNNSADFYSGGNFTWLDSGGADTYVARMRLSDDGDLQIGYGGAGLQQADGNALTITTPASGGGQGISLKRLDSNNDQVMGQITWSNNTQDGLTKIYSKTEGATNSSILRIFCNEAGTERQVVEISPKGSAAEANLQITNHLSNSFNHVQENLVPGLTQGETAYLGLGKENNTKNTGYLGYYWYADAHNDSFLHMSHWGSNYLFRVYGQGNYYFAGSAISDRDLKENIVDIPEPSLEKVKQLRVRKFNMKPLTVDDDVTPTKVGFIAQEVQTAMPNVVTGTDGEKDMAVDTTGVVGHLVKAIQELSTELDAAKARITTLEG